MRARSAAAATVEIMRMSRPTQRRRVERVASSSMRPAMAKRIGVTIIQSRA